MGLNRNFHGKKGGPDIFGGLKGGVKIFAIIIIIIILHQSPP